MASFILLKALILCTVSATQVLGQSCPCGYKDSSGHVWREAIVSTFTQAAGALAAVNADWIIATDFEGQGGTSTADIQYVTANVFQHQDALGLKASAYDNSGSVKCAEIFTKRSDILYGSFRMQAQVPSVPGVVFGFFTYISDTQEQDIEFLSSDSDYYQHLYYTNQPGTVNGDVDPQAAKNVEIPGADFTTFGVHRFDWLPAATTYSYAGTSDSGASITSSTTITKNVPTTPSEFILNVWSNGDPQFSKGPPVADAIATVQYVHLYFNSTTLSASSFSTQCNAAGNIAPCSV
ncbi:concanavalin A-like lectin/glucanase domain-containing protein [Mycena albidolilacea]|uniref:Concanavalin A-like lectin/glucanase domain-containing protein n=1 Tax=Mycena albidolilacea TaxID=1033008 RepID=A0AAD7F4Y5_9AGAR|nr:concanavalin A-like lectin/glucanase domain-containing protein [Mycena albidolilacea]